MTNTNKLILSGLGAALIAVGALIKIPFPLVPLTLQLLMILLIGHLLGPKYGSLAVMIYLLMGLAGLPVFANGGGVAYLFKPTFGYLLGFFGAVLFVGWLSKPNYQWYQLVIINLVGTLIIYMIGLPYLYMIGNYILKMDLNFVKLAYSGWLIFIPTDVFSCLVAAFIAQRLKKTFK
jgi:biotin transport system substrate-specific component